MNPTGLSAHSVLAIMLSVLNAHTTLKAFSIVASVNMCVCVYS